MIGVREFKFSIQITPKSIHLRMIINSTDNNKPFTNSSLMEMLDFVTS
jgi:hypothetical protein